MRHSLAILLILLTAPVQAADKTTQHTISLPGGPFAFTAAVETIKLANPQGAPVAEIVTTAFLHDAPAPRPITFAFNGGPGAASAFLDVGAIGPWRVPIALPVVPSQNPTLIDNAETWLPFTDIVFIDPPGTGYSRATGPGPGPGPGPGHGPGDDARKPFQTVDGDIATLATVIRRWLAAHHRLDAPIILAGESYGGFRAPRLARALLDQQGAGVSGLVMISPVLDFNGRDAPYDPMRWVARLPSLVAAARTAASRDSVQDAERYAAGDYLQDLVRGPNDAAATARMAARVAALTGLDPAVVQRRNSRIDLEAMLRDRRPGQVATPYDATLFAADPFPAAPHDNSPDALLDGLRGPLTGAMLLLYERLDWLPDGAPARRYDLLNDSIAHDWDYGRGNVRPESMTALRQYLALDPAAHAIVVHGLYDLVTPYFASKLLLDQVPETTPPGRLALRLYPGGHMAYLQQSARAALRDDAAALIAQAVASRSAPSPAP
jgi:carboxypeptidase C (cathepsin A)